MSARPPAFTPQERMAILADSKRLIKFKGQASLIKPNPKIQKIKARLETPVPSVPNTPGRLRPLSSSSTPALGFDHLGDTDLPDEAPQYDVYSAADREAARMAAANAADAKKLDALAHNCLLQLDRYMQLRSLRLMDLFRSRKINTSSKSEQVTGGDDGDNELDADEFAAILADTELNLSMDEIHAVIRFLDHSGDGVLDVNEVDLALRKAKKRQRNIPRDAMTRLTKAEASNAKKTEQLQLFLPKVLQRRYYAVRPDESTQNNLQWDTIHRTPSHGSPTKTVPEA